MMLPLLQQGVTAQAMARPEATALVFRGAHLSYGALEETSNRLANALVEITRGLKSGERVATANVARLADGTKIQ